MQANLIPLNQLSPGLSGIVKQLTSEGIYRRRMLDLGFIVNTCVESLRRSPSGDPTAFQVRGTIIALRTNDAAQILVEV